MVGRMLLPSLGGTPSVWNTCVVFFQAVLLLGYGYAHFGARKLTIRQNVLVHWILLGAVCFLLPIQLMTDWAVPTESSPIGWLLGQLMLCVGIPFFVISSNAPLLQRWYCKATQSEDKDPYFLYAISNVGSLGALLLYPLAIEPTWGITTQTVYWLFGFLVLAVSFAACGFQVLRAADQSHETELSTNKEPEADYQPLSWAKRLHFIALAAVPSSLMLGVTTFITTDVGSFPLMWVLPLAVYLLTFILVFAERQVLPHWLVVRVLPPVLLMMPIVTMMDLGTNPILMVTVHLVAFFLVAMMCHGEMARRRPAAEQLTEFYLLMSIGGVVGGAFNALLAPVLFNEVIEYPLMLIAAALLMPSVSETLGKLATARQGEKQILSLTDMYWFLGLGLYIGVAYGVLSVMGVTELSTMGIFVFGVPAMVCYSAVGRTYRFALCYVALIVGCSMVLVDRETIAKERGFFGVNEVALDAENDFKWLVNGRTMHGLQRASQTDSPDPISYFHPEGPVGDVFNQAGLTKDAKVGIVGLGIGSMVAYAKPGQYFDVYEIDPIVVDMASNPEYFNYLSSCKAELRIILGDARIQLGKTTPPDNKGDADDLKYDLLFLDAFSSDSVPTHLVTKEAMELYLKKLKPNGLMVMNITNKFVDLRPIVDGFGNEFNLSTAVRRDILQGDHIDNDGRLSCVFAVLSRDKGLIQRFRKLGSWTSLESGRDACVWTDEHANLFDVLDW